MANRYQILAVDDTRINRILLKTILDDEYEVIEACDGEEALALLKECPERFLGVLLDINMPKKDGFQVLKEMRSTDGLKNIPVIVITAEQSKKSEIKSLEMGANDFLTHPLEASIVKLRVGNIRNNRELEEMKLQETYRIMEERQRKELEKKQMEYLHVSLEAENLVTRCVRLLYANLKDESELDHVLSLIGEFLGASRVYIMKTMKQAVLKAHEWRRCPEETDINSLEGEWLLTFARQMKRGGNQFLKQNGSIVFNDFGSLKDKNPTEYQLFQRLKINSLVIVPIYSNEQLKGYMAAENCLAAKQLNAKSILEALGYFIGAMYRYEEALEKLEFLSYHDTLIKAQNRNAYNRDYRLLEESSNLSLGVIYADVNGMKEINDSQGHQAGDRVLSYVADQITDIFPEKYFYRIGGDEFVVMYPGIGEAKFQEKSRQLKERFQSQKKVRVAVGTAWTGEITNLGELLSKADKNMYTEKKEFYLEHTQIPYRHKRRNLVHFMLENQKGKFNMKVILASASPRRKELMEQLGIDFICIPSSKEEVVSGIFPEQVVEELSFQKAEDILEKTELSEDTLIIGSDTVVALGQEILGKPKSLAHAGEMLHKLQGRSHEVYTGVTLLICRNGEVTRKTFCECAKVTMYPMTKGQIDAYIATGESVDKAGAYAIQGKCSIFIKKVEGEYNTVVGFPIARVYQELVKLNILI